MGSKVEALEKEMQDLSRDELAALRSRFVKFDAGEWDRQIENDIDAGKLDKRAARALGARDRGESNPIPFPPFETNQEASKE